jgi:hypothetical protein
MKSTSFQNGAGEKDNQIETKAFAQVKDDSEN